MITTYQQFKSIAKFDQIIITDTQTQTGYIKFLHQLWRTLQSNNDPNAKETLQGYIKHNLLDSEYDLQSIIQDTCILCHKDVKPYKLKYHEYAVHYKYDYLLNTIEYKFRNIPKHKIITENLRSNKIINPDVNIDSQIVQNILESLVNDSNIILNYKQLCYNILVKRPTEIFTFYDYSNNKFHLTTWITDTLFNLRSSEFRCVIVKDQDLKDDNKVLERLKLIPNIIVNSKSKNMYDIPKFEKYINNNKTSIQQHFQDQTKTFNHINDLFCKTNLLFCNFLKWICT